MACNYEASDAQLAEYGLGKTCWHILVCHEIQPYPPAWLSHQITVTPAKRYLNLAARSNLQISLKRPKISGRPGRVTGNVTRRDTVANCTPLGDRGKRDSLEAFLASILRALEGETCPEGKKVDRGKEKALRRSAARKHRARASSTLYLFDHAMLRLLVRNGLNRSSQLRRQVSTASYTLTERQPSNSPIWIRAQSESSLLKGVSPTDFQLYTNVFSKEEQTELLKCALKRLDEIRGVSRTIKKRRKEAGGVATAIAASEPPVDVQSQFLPDTCYEFDEVTLS